MKSFYIAAACGLAPGRAVLETGAPSQHCMAFFVVPAQDLRSALRAWLDEMDRIKLTPILLHGCGPLEKFDAEYQIFPIDPEEVASMGEQALETNKIVVSDFFGAQAPDAPALGIWFGFVDRKDMSLQEVAVRSADLRMALKPVFKDVKGLLGIHGFSDASLADDAATFAGKPLALAALAVSQSPSGTLHLGETLPGE